MFDDSGDGERLDRGRVLSQCLDLYLKTWVGRGEHAVAASLVVMDPLLPASGVIHRPWSKTMVTGAAGSGVLSAVMRSS